MIAAFPLGGTGGDANVQVRGVSPSVLEVRDNVRVVQGRFLEPGLNELVVGRNVPHAYAGLDWAPRSSSGAEPGRWWAFRCGGQRV